MNLLSFLYVERAYKLKKKFSVFFSQFVAKKEVIYQLINLDIVRSTKIGDCFFKSADQSVENFDGANWSMKLCSDFSQGK